MTKDELNRFATNYAKAWCSQDPDRVAAFYAKGAAISINGGPSATICEVARAFIRDFPDMVVTFDKLETDGGRVAFHWTLIGSYVPNGNRVRISGYELWKIDADELIAEAEIFFAHVDPSQTRDLMGTDNFVFTGNLQKMLGLAKAAAKKA